MKKTVNKYEAWSQFLNSEFGIGAAIFFAAGSDILLDHIKKDMAELASMPIGTHIGQLEVSLLNSKSLRTILDAV